MANSAPREDSPEWMRQLLDKLKQIGELTWEDLVSDTPKPLGPKERQILREIAETVKQHREDK
jgi:hypothetical protein